jgi:3-oxoadipate enol-lactonase/4-carboxymuconolactone decarboxylase
MPFAQSQDARIYWRSQGLLANPPLVLMHSIGTDNTLYDRSAPFLEEQFRLLRIDIRGHGASDAPDSEYTLSLLARDCVAVMDAAGVAGAIICGTSLGAMIALQLALDAPSRVRGLVLANTSAEMDPALWPERIATVRQSGVASIAEGWVTRHFSEQFRQENRIQTDTVFSHMTTMSSVGYVGCAAAIRDMAVIDLLPRVIAPTLVIGGELDDPTPFLGHGDRIAAAIPGATAELLPTGHLACVEQPEQFAQCVSRLAERCK